MVPWAHQNGILISSAVFAGLTTVIDRPTDRQTDHATLSVTTVCIYEHTIVMEPNNNCDDLYGAVIMTIAIARVHPVEMVNAD